MKSIYSLPKVVKYDDLNKYWYVYFRYDKKLCRYKRGINEAKTYKERLAEANALKDALTIKLQSGWNPLVPEVINDGVKLTLQQAIDYALEQKKEKLAHKSYLDYSCSIRFIGTAIESLEYQKLLIADVKRIHIKTILARVKKQRKATNKSYNKYLEHFRAVLGELLEWEILEYNPASKIKDLQVEETAAHIPATAQEHKIIKDHLFNNHRNYFRFIATLYHTGIRPEEIRQIQIKMVNMTERKITLPSSITKTPKIRIVTINQHLYKLLEEMNFQNLSKNYYLFGAINNNHRFRYIKGEDFTPGELRMKRDTATRRWKTIVKDGLGLTHITMYSNKKGGANAKILAGISIDALQELYGHSSKMMTKKYITVLQEVNRKQIMELSPEY